MSKVIKWKKEQSCSIRFRGQNKEQQGEVLGSRFQLQIRKSCLTTEESFLTSCELPINGSPWQLDDHVRESMNET